MQILDLYPLKGFFHPHEPLDFWVQIKTKRSGSAVLRLSMYALQVCHYETQIHLTFNEGEQAVPITLPEDINLPCGGYALCAAYDGEEHWTAFDIQNKWLDFPRYGFLSDFSADLDDERAVTARMEALAKYHITGLQFYDWQYRHDQLVAPADEYLDPLQRPLSLHTIRRLIASAHQANMAAMPYLAIYGASIEFWRQHPDWGLYDQAGKPLLFEDFLGLMDPSDGSPWSAHLAQQCRRTLQSLHFDGLHIDQYGDPKQAFTESGAEIDLPQAFVDFINVRKAELDVPVLFNAVGNWPIEALAKSKADFMYIEVWPPTPRFTDLRRIVEDAHRLSGGKAVVIPLYIPAAQKTNLLLADAVITASGGTHLELGDDLRLLSDPYFPKSESLDEPYLADLRRYWDFIVANQVVLGPQAETPDMEPVLPQGVYGIVRRNGNLLALHLIQITSEDCWTEPQLPRNCLLDVPVSLAVGDAVKQILWASPDLPAWQWQPLAFTWQDGKLSCRLPSLTHWSSILIEIDA